MAQYTIKKKVLYPAQIQQVCEELNRVGFEFENNVEKVIITTTKTNNLWKLRDLIQRLGLPKGI